MPKQFRGSYTVTITPFTEDGPKKGRYLPIRTDHRAGAPSEALPHHASVGPKGGTP